MKVAILKYNAGNVRSVSYALERLGIEAIITDDAEELKSADRIIFPGVGEAGTAMKYLRARKLDALIPDLKQPVMGICLGLQLMCRFSEEGSTKCLDIFHLDVKQFAPVASGKLRLKVPQIGWNTIGEYKSALFNGIRESEYMYFVHGYYAETGLETISDTSYGTAYSSALQKDNFCAVQFHPEKSGSAGNAILSNFIEGTTFKTE